MAKNVLLVTADQFRGDCLSALGHDFVKTHHLDTLASDGALFHKHYCQATPCAPSRASLLTGLYQLNHRAVRNGPPLDRRHDNLARMVRRHGHDPACSAIPTGPATRARPLATAPGWRPRRECCWASAPTPAAA